ncbi:J domain-containing protein [Chitinimonas lacunae]|uniref:J domain-containing protein n=1 Tax=Chitinimonas lacunae TaxID=1963018 RepID=A0ABV8MIP7_9NEIS
MEATLTRQSLYEWLGLSPDAGLEAITAAYRRLAGQWHPARLGLTNQSARERFFLLANAYTTLSNPEERARYHDYLQGQGDEPFSMSAPSPDPFQLYIELCQRYVVSLQEQQRSPDAIHHALLGEGCPESIAHVVLRQAFGQKVAHALSAESQPKKGMGTGAVVALVAGVLLLGVMFIGIIAAIAIPQFVEYQKKGQLKAAEFEARQAVRAVAEYISTQDSFPADLEATGYTLTKTEDSEIKAVSYDPIEGVIRVQFKEDHDFADTPLIAFSSATEDKLCLQMEGQTFKPENTCPEGTGSALQNPMVDEAEPPAEEEAAPAEEPAPDEQDTAEDRTPSMDEPTPTN